MNIPRPRQALRRLACLLVLPLTLSTAALAEPASKASLLTYFEIMNTQQVARRAADQVIEGMNTAIKVMPEAQRRLLLPELPGLQAEARKHLSWQAVQPLALQCYQQTMQEADVQVLTAYARSPGGRLYHAKLLPALEQDQAAMKVYLRLRFAALGKNRPDPAQAPQPARLPAPGSKAALVYAMMIRLARRARAIRQPHGLA